MTVGWRFLVEIFTLLGAASLSLACTPDGRPHWPQSPPPPPGLSFSGRSAKGLQTVIKLVSGGSAAGSGTSSSGYETVGGLVGVGRSG